LCVTALQYNTSPHLARTFAYCITLSLVTEHALTITTPHHLYRAAHNHLFRNRTGKHFYIPTDNY